VAHWLEGYDVVYAKRTCRNGESAAKRLTAFLFYRLIQKMSRVRIPEDTGDFRLLSRRAVHAVCQMREQHRFMKGMFAWIGYPQKAVPYQRAPRHAGTTKWNYWKLWNFALEGITSFSCMPLKVATYIGLCSASGAFAYGLYIVLRTLMVGNPVPGYPSLLTAVMFLGGLQLFSIGVIGEYLARMFDESKQRPLYFLKDGLPRSRTRRPVQAREHDLAFKPHTGDIS
jgi:glycosyltransferase involved in cell wall biosynthesis